MDNLTMQKSQKFISLFKKLERLVSDKSSLPKETSISKKLSELTGENNVFGFYKKDIQRLTELRNVIIHGSVEDGRAIAEPHDEIISKLEEIVEKIENPPRVYPEFHSKIETIETEIQISVALDKMYEGDYSQLPVLENENFVDLLTSDTIVRWIAANKEEGGYLLENVTIREVLTYKEFDENYKFISRNTTLIEALKVFEEVEYKKQPLDALLITNDGKKEQKLLGIITHYDVSRMVSLI